MGAGAEPLPPSPTHFNHCVTPTWLDMVDIFLVDAYFFSFLYSPLSAEKNGLFSYA